MRIAESASSCARLPGKELTPLCRWEKKLKCESRARTQTDGAHDYSHLCRVWENAKAIERCDGPADSLVLLAGAFFHDLVNLPKDHPNRKSAARLSADAAIQVLKRMSFPESKLANVHHAIIAHSYSGNERPETLEARILRDADRLDALGAIGIARTFYVSGIMQSALYDTEDPFGAQRHLSDKEYSLDHFRTKILGLADDMETRMGRRIARYRIKFVRRFICELSVEIGCDRTDVSY
ncbi:HD domain-containing protein [Dongia sp.]|uniref:HD domain-containing protein n=1 Tax=Dongia sp. TaxID=1977262 RepID=UPI0035AEF7A8